MEQLTGQDASFVFNETPRSHMHIGALAIYDQSTAPESRVRFRDILSNVQSRLHLAKSFRRRLVTVPFDADNPYWIEDGRFDLEYHVRHIALPKPGSWEQLLKLAARLHSYPLDRNYPLWEMYVVSGLNAISALPQGSFAVITKVHHAAIDGASGVEMTESLHDLQPEPPLLDPASGRWMPDKEPNAIELLMRAWGNQWMEPWRFAQLAARVMPAAGTALRGLAASENRAMPRVNVPRTSFNKAVTAHRVLDGREYSLAALRRIKSAVRGATVNDVVLSIVGGALHRYLKGRGELPKESLVAMAPVNVRVEGETGGGNRVAAMLVALGTQIEDPLKRLSAVRESTKQSKALNEAVGARLMTDYARFVPARLAALAARLYASEVMNERINVPFNCVVTNVPGPQVPLYFNGARLVRQFGLGPVFDGVGLMFPVFSYCGSVTISINACRELVPEASRLGDFLDIAFDELERAADA